MQEVVLVLELERVVDSDKDKVNPFNVEYFIVVHYRAPQNKYKKSCCYVEINYSS